MFVGPRCGICFIPHTSGYKNFDVAPGVFKNTYTLLPVNNCFVAAIFVFQLLQQRKFAKTASILIFNS